MLLVYGHRLTKSDLETTKRMMEAVGIADYKVVDLMSQDAESGSDPCITMGALATRKISGTLKAFPDFDQFTGKLDPVKKALRKTVFDLLKEVANQIQAGAIKGIQIKQAPIEEKVFDRPSTLQEFKSIWTTANISYIIVNSAGERICIYNGDKPDIQANSFYTVSQFSCLLDLMDIFGAKNLLIFRKGEEKGHEI